MSQILLNLIKSLENLSLSNAGIIPGAAPIPSFGDHTRSKVATLGLNPSDREFFGKDKKELEEQKRRFHTLASLGISGWAEVKDKHLRSIQDSCREYFFRPNPYQWFKQLDDLIVETQNSYYDQTNQACHLDLVPYATEGKWSKLEPKQRKLLLKTTSDFLGLLLRESSIRLLIINGNGVVKEFEKMLSPGEKLEKKEMPDWTLPRKRGKDVLGYSYKGTVKKLAGIELNRDLLVLGFNHNIQNGRGVAKVKKAIGDWIKKEAE
jgi:hypothetical protein